MGPSLAATEFRRHVRFMPRSRTIDPDVAQIGKAVARLREAAAKDLTQDACAACMDPPITPQYWGMHERGEVPGIVKPKRQRDLIAAISKAADLADPLSLDDLDAAIDGDEATPRQDPAAGRLVRLARELAPGAPDPNKRRAVFPIPDGDVVIEIPAQLTPAGFKQVEAFLAVFLKANTPK